MAITISGDKAPYLEKLVEVGEGACCLSFVGVEGWRVAVPLLTAVATSPVLASALGSRCPCENDIVVLLPSVTTENIQMLVDFMMGETISGNMNDLSVLDELCRQLGINFAIDFDIRGSLSVDNPERSEKVKDVDFVAVDDEAEGQHLMNNGNSEEEIEIIWQSPGGDIESASGTSNDAEKCPVTQRVSTNKEKNIKGHTKRRKNVEDMDRYTSAKNHQCPKCFQYFQSRRGMLSHRKFCSIAELPTTCASSNASPERIDSVDSSSATNPFETVVISSIRHVNNEETSTLSRNTPSEISTQCRSVPQNRKDFWCDVCEKGFSKMCYLNVHKKTHTEGRRIVKCRFCDGCFLSKSSCKLHEMVHSYPKFFACKVCGKRFHVSSECRIHESTHIDESDRPFRCRICNKAYKRTFDLRRHMRKHHKESL